MSIARHHAEWLSLLEISGPFLSMPVLMRVFPQGLDQRDPQKAKELRLAYEEWLDKPVAPGKQRAWVDFVITRLLEFPAEIIVEGQNMPSGIEAPMAEYAETVRADMALVGPSGHSVAGVAQLLVQVYPLGQKLDSPVAGKHWKASPATRMTELLHAANVPLGIVTDGEQWMLVFAPRGESTGYASFYAALWQEEPITLRAFHSLLHVKRFFGVAEGDTLFALLKESAQDQQDVTDQLGLQVRHAVEVLVQALDRLDQDTGRQLLHETDTKVLYEAALTVMMRLVFLFSAEERGLLRLGEPLYDDNYAVSSLGEQLREAADQHGEEVLERRFDAWARLLATFRAVHGGVSHESMRLPAYGGTLFDPDRFPFLEGRTSGTSWKETAAQPLAVNNRVVLHLLESLQLLQVKVPGGGPAEARRLSFRALDIEQIGHVYEGLLDHTAVRASSTILGLKGTKDKEPEIPLEELEELLSQGEDRLIEFLKEKTKRSDSALRRTLRELLTNHHKLLIVCGQDTTLRDRIRPFAGLLRNDSFDMPVVVLHGGVYVTQGTTRRSSGTHYTPRSLTEPIVQHTLEPLIYEGPAKGWAKEKWKLKSPREILSLKVCDIATGSGAFLVQACRYMAERLVEAWENLEQANPGRFMVAPKGDLSTGDPAERLLPEDTEERLAIARRAIADRCLYGVDINPLAVEMAKLSLWLVTLQKDRPFTFLNHALKYGDSLLGITSLEQLENFSLRPEGGKQQAFARLNLWRHIEEAKKKREVLEAISSDTPEQIAAKATLHAAAEEEVTKLNAAANILVALEFKGLKGKAYDIEREITADKLMKYWVKGLPELHAYANTQLSSYHCLHWALTFPEIMVRGGFDAFVGNPPFAGGKRIRSALGNEYRIFIAHIIGRNVPGSADLCAYFFLRAADLLLPGGHLGLIATNTIAQGDTREVALDQLYSNGYVCIRAIDSQPWPGTASLEVAHVWMRRGAWEGAFFLNGTTVEGITPFLTQAGRSSGKPYRLAVNADKSYVGSVLSGIGFVLTPDEAQTLAHEGNNARCLYPYLNGEDITSRWDQSPSRWVINFWDWPLCRGRAGSWNSADENTREEWLKSGVVPRDFPGCVAADYPDLLKIVRERVKPHRDQVNRKAYRDKWWLFAEPCLSLYEAVSGLGRVLVIPETTKYCTFAWLNTKIVFSHMTKVLTFESDSVFCLVCSSIHEEWARYYSSTLETRLKYAPTDAFETFPFPSTLDELNGPGADYERCRRDIMMARQEGITATYNRFHNPAEEDVLIKKLRNLHTIMDRAVAIAYGWQALDLGHGFRETKQGVRYTISEAARREVLDRLLALNHQRYEEEVKAGLHDKKAKGATVGVKRRRNKKNIITTDMPTLL